MYKVYILIWTTPPRQTINALAEDSSIYIYKVAIAAAK